jgi:V/A-type H+-transporting ATPase subunit E
VGTKTKEKRRASMNLFEIDDAILACVDLETGDIIDVEKLEALELERDTKISNIACWIKNLKAEAEAIISAANKEAEDLKTKVQGDLKMAASQSVAATKKDIETLVVTKMTAADVTAALTSAEFVKEVIMAVAKGFNTEEPVDLEVVLPEALKKDLEPFVTKEIANVLKGQVEASFTKKIAGGFTIGPKDGGYFISFTEETFNALISEYLRPATKKILFG